METELLQGNDDIIEKKRTLWEMSRQEIINLWQSQGYSQAAIDDELWEVMKDWNVDTQALHESQNELQALLLEWRQASQLRIAQASLERCAAEQQHQATIREIITFQHTHGIVSEAEVTPELRTAYEDIKARVDEALLLVNVSTSEYRASIEELTELVAVRGEFYGKLRVPDGNGGMRDEYWGTDIYDQMPLNRPGHQLK